MYADDGSYTVTVCVTDDDTASACDTLQVTVNNAAPIVDAGLNQTADEGDTVSLSPVTFNDLGTLDTHTATVNWGDGTATEPGAVAETPSGPPGSTSGTNGTVSGSHVYADDGTYTVEVCVTDDASTTCDSLMVTINNVAPTLDAGSDQTSTEGSVVSLDPTTFNDLGISDTHTVAVNWGVGAGSEPGSVTESPSGPPGSTAGADGTADPFRLCG